MINIKSPSYLLKQFDEIHEVPQRYNPNFPISFYKKALSLKKLFNIVDQVPEEPFYYDFTLKNRQSSLNSKTTEKNNIKRHHKLSNLIAQKPPSSANFVNRKNPLFYPNSNAPYLKQISKKIVYAKKRSCRNIHERDLKISSNISPKYEENMYKTSSKVLFAKKNKKSADIDTLSGW